MFHRRSFPSVAAACLGMALAGTLLGAHQPQFRAGVDLVHLDVSVLDNERRAVRGLVMSDFEIFEDGKRQQIASFAAVDIPDAIEPSTPWMREVPPDTRRNDTLNDRRLFVMVIDDGTAQMNARALHSTKAVARRFIERLGPSDLMAIVFTLNNRHAQDYTSDRARLLAAVDKFNVGFRNMADLPLLGESGNDHLYFRSTIETLGKVAEVLASLPEQRKALIYVGQGVPMDPELASSTPLIGAVGAVDPAAQQSMLMQRLSAAYRMAQRANVAFYTLDTCGLRTAPAIPPPPPTCVPGLEVDFLRGIAAATG